GNDEEAGEDLKAYDASTSSAFTATGYYLAKFRNEGQRIDASETYASSQNYIIWRLAELYLDYAEANSLLGKNDIALEYVNKVRERVKVTPYSSVTLNDVLNERRVELAFEETTYWDVLRHNQAVEKFSYRTPIMGIKIVNNAGNYSYTPVKVHSVETAVRNFNERNYQLPIPWDEVRYHKIEQNPGYVEN
ncbi:MAG: RagB/SusD family nutrient uptake outer membrane protein, partial [Phocaeicola sp.]